MIFTELDETAHDTTLEETLDSLRMAQRYAGTIGLVVFDLPDWYSQTDPTLVASIEAARSSFTEVLGSDYVFHASDAAQLGSAFEALADKINREANAWYEFFVCPPIRGGTDHSLTIQLEEYDGSLTASFDATGFDAIGHACPHSQNVKQETTTAFCESRQCGFFEGVFCGICDIAVADPRYTLQPEESPVFRVTAGDVRVGGHFAFEASDNTPVAVTAHVGRQERSSQRLSALPAHLA